MFTSPNSPALAQLWHVLKTFHKGEFVKRLLEDHDKNFARVARRANWSPQNLSDLFQRADIGDTTLLELQAAAKLDIMGAMRAEMQRLGVRVDGSMAGDPSVPYSPRPSTGAEGSVVLTIRMEDYTPEAQAQLLAFLSALPKRSVSPVL